MEGKKFSKERIDKNSPKYVNAIDRLKDLYPRDNIRTKFARDYTRIIHCFGLRRLKHKTQVFFAPRDDHKCTRLEHALHVTSISQTISKELARSCNVELINRNGLNDMISRVNFM